MRSKYQELEDRTYRFARSCRDFCFVLPKNTANFEYSKQLIRSSGSVATNYIEANECLGTKDFLMRIKICRKEAKESQLWINLVTPKEQQIQKNLIKESDELVRIFASILRKYQ